VMVKDYRKLFGGDVIIAHRLLKNSITLDEYVLLTNSFIEHYIKDSSLPLNNKWIRLKKKSDKYNVLGKIEYHYSSIDLLKNNEMH